MVLLGAAFVHPAPELRSLQGSDYVMPMVYTVIVGSMFCPPVENMVAGTGELEPMD